jgi:nicotinamidase/pyrazinamidase
MKIEPNSALIVVDVQNDFIEGGALAVPNSLNILPVLMKAITAFRKEKLPIVYTRDWHPDDHCSFSTTPEYKDKSWPKHCVQGTDGSDLVLNPFYSSIIIEKGFRKDEEAYSGFAGVDLHSRVNLEAYLKSCNVKNVYICGLATDFCVSATTKDSAKLGFNTIVITDACAAVNEETGIRAMEEMWAMGVTTKKWGE